jgi:hypothetical protein
MTRGLVEWELLKRSADGHGHGRHGTVGRGRAEFGPNFEAQKPRGLTFVSSPPTYPPFPSRLFP